MIDTDFDKIILIAITTDPLQINHLLLTFLRHLVRTHGSKLRLRNVDDRIAFIHESGSTILTESCKCLMSLYGFL